MYRCCKKIIIFIFLFAFYGNLFANNALEDSKIFEALDAVDSKNYTEALNIYNNLYKDTKKIEYLEEVINLSIILGMHTEAINLIKEYENINKNNINVKESLANIYVSLKEVDNAIEVYKDIIKIEDNEANNIVIGNLYFFKNDLINSRKHFIIALDKEFSELSLFHISRIDFIQKNFDLSVPIIKKYFPNGTSDFFYQALVELALKNNNLPEVQSLYLYYYDKNSNKTNAKNLIGIYILEKKLEKATNLAKKHDFNDILIDLYIMQEDYKNARIALKQSFNKPKDNAYLIGALAIIDFQEASDKKTILEKVIKDFKESLKIEKNDVFYNYLGYLLIDFDINIDEGIEYVKEALKLNPGSFIYIDSLAWGYYKNNDCESAKREMNKISPLIIKMEDEIRKHLEIIDKCLKK